MMHLPDQRAPARQTDAESFLLAVHRARVQQLEAARDFLVLSSLIRDAQDQVERAA